MIVMVGCSSTEDDVKYDDSVYSTELSNYDYIGTFMNGDEVYAESYRYNLQEAAWKMVILRDHEIYKTFDGMPSVPKFNKERTKMLYIDNLQFEEIGNIMVYDSESEEETAYTDFDYETPQDTVKDVEWYKDGSLICVIGYAMGTISQGGELYILDMATKDYVKVDLDDKIADWTDRHYEIVDIYVEEYGIKLTLIEWIDDNLTEYYYTTHMLLEEDLWE